MADSRERAGSQAYAYASRAVDCLLCGSYDTIKIPSFSRSSTGYLPHQDLAGDPPSLLLLVSRCGSDIIIRNHRADLQSFLLCLLHRHADIHVVPGVIAVEAGNSLSPVSGLEGIMECNRSRRREDLADSNCIAHVLPEITDERRLMTGSAASDDSNLGLQKRRNSCS